MIVGSQAFFKNIKGFTPSDIDILEFVENPSYFKNVRQFRFEKKCVFQWRDMSASEFVKVTLLRNTPLEACKFIVPEFINKVNLTLDQLKELEPLFNKLSDKHSYVRLIYEFYIANNGFYLTDQQLQAAYEKYKKYRLNHEQVS